MIKSVENTLDALANTINSGNTPLAGSVLNNIHKEAAEAIATQLAAVDFSNTVTLKDQLATKIETALKDDALPAIQANYASVITLSNTATMANSIATTTVDAVSQAVGTSLSTSGTTTEAAVITEQKATDLSSAIDTTVTTTESNVSVNTSASLPTATLSSFADGKQDVAVGPASLQVTFSGSVDDSTVLAAGSVTLLVGSAPASGAVSYDPATFVVTFTATLSGQASYTLRLSGIKDVFGNTLPDRNFTFATVTTPPPPTGATGGTGGSGTSGTLGG